MSSYQHELSVIKKAIAQANDELVTIRQEGMIIHIKPDGSPVTSGDLSVNRAIQNAVLSAFPDDGWLSEETPDDAARLRKNRVWVLDPIDGTKPLIRSLPQFTISLALIIRGQAAVGVIFNPATQEYFSAVQDEQPMLNGQPIHVRRATNERFSFMFNPGSISRSTLRPWRETVHCRPMLGSIAYSLALVSAGWIDGLINLGMQNEWDIAAACVLVQAGGGVVLDVDGKPIQFNQPHPTVKGIVATRPDAMPVIQPLLNSLHS